MSRISKPKKENHFGDFPKKWAKILENELDPEDPFISKAQQSSAEQLQKMVFDCNQNIVNLEKDQSADGDLLSLKEQVKIAEEPYKIGIKVNQAKARYCIYLRRSLGQPSEEE